MIADPPESQESNILKLIPKKHLSDPRLRPVFTSLDFEVSLDYDLSMRRSIVNYVLSDPAERRRLHITSIERSRNHMVTRAPVPWHMPYFEAKTLISQELFVTNTAVVELQQIFSAKFAHLRFVRIHDLEKAGLPMVPSEFEKLVASHCQELNEHLCKTWISAAADSLFDGKRHWYHLVPKGANENPYMAEKFFACVASLMSHQLRSLVRDSLQDLVDFLNRYSEGNDFNVEYDETLFVKQPLLALKLVVDEPKIGFEPSFKEVRDSLVSCFHEIVMASKNIPRVETELFPGLRDAALVIRTADKDELMVTSAIEQSLESYRKNTIGPQRYLNSYKNYMSLIDGKADRNITSFLAESHSIEGFKAKLDEVRQMWTEISLMRLTVPLNMCCLYAEGLNHDLLGLLEALRLRITAAAMLDNREDNRNIAGNFDDMNDKCNSIPASTAELVELTNYVNNAMDKTFYTLKERVEESFLRLLFLLDYAEMPAEDIALNKMVLQWPFKIRGVFDITQNKLSDKRDVAEHNLKKRVKAFEERLIDASKQLDWFKKRDVMAAEEMKDCVDKMHHLSNQLDELASDLEQINIEEKLLEWEQTSFPQLVDLIQAKDPYEKLWKTAFEYHTKSDQWLNGPFQEQNAEVIENDVQEMYRILHKLSKTFADNPHPKRVADQACNRIDRFKAYLPLMGVICNPGLKLRHWEQMSEVVGVDITPDENTTLTQMLELNLNKFLPKLEEISGAASKEHAIEKSLSKMKKEWANVQFEFVPYRDSDIKILAAIDDIQVLLDDHIIKAQTMMGSPFIKPVEQEAKAWQTKLIDMQDILESWLNVQATWLYLEPIFSSEDIMAQMPDEARSFGIVDSTWRDIMTQAVKNTNCLVATDQPNMLKRLKEANELLEDIQRGLNDYLEKKRLYFPRFFFLSNDELLEILSETKDPLRVQPHLKKCFEGIHHLEFNTMNEIVGMISAEGELVPLAYKVNPAKAKGMVEKWLLQVEEVMISSIRKVIGDSMLGYQQVPRRQWVLEWPGQVVICVSQTYWTSEVSTSLGDETGAELEAYYQQCCDQITESVQMVRGKLLPNHRMTMNALTVLDVHARDVVKHLVDMKVKNTQDFSWMSQMRYYWNSDMYVHMITTELQYGYEYLGNSGRLVVTPLTDRCYRTLMGALKMNLGGAPEGPAGTGKTETTKDLAKALAKQCVVFNCSDGLDYKAMGKFFKGLAQAGAWACFDEFNRIELEVLSVIAQQILTIQQAIIARAKRFVFEGTDLSLNPSCSVFITMNPGYAGRQELPDNLKVLFRSVAMMVPDYAMIGEISLYSMGFLMAKELSEKIVNVYKLCSEQLSSQSHYDYGMRAVKSVLTAAGNLKLKYPDQDENQILLKAIMDVNLPKFLQQDIALFEGIMGDLFMGITLQPPDYSAFIDALKSNMDKRQMQHVPWHIDKIIQIYEMILVRHGLMIVGEPMGGKTTGYQVLADALGDLHAAGLMGENNVLYRIINPKAITMGQLYGCFDPVSHEWTDGVLATTFREYASNPTLERKWIMLDGPVDAVWIENMNTVLDDNKKLCLMSGEIIQMTNQMNLIFEPADLEQASPATVSRCGMIYLEPINLGWRPCKKSWIQNALPRNVTDEIKEMLDDLFEWLIPPSLQFIRKNCKQFVNISEIHAVYSMMRLMSCMMDEIKQADAESDTSLTAQQVGFYCLNIHNNN